MTLEEAKKHAEIISREYGDAIVFREPTIDDTYQCMACSLPKGAKPVIWYKDGKQR